MNNKNPHKIYFLDAILFIVLWMVIWWCLMIWKQNDVLNTLLAKHELKYTKFSAIDEILNKEFYDEELLKNSTDDMVEWALVWYVWAIDDPHTMYLKEEENTKIKNDLINYELSDENKKKENIEEEKDLKLFINNLLNELLGEEEVNQELMAKIFLIMKLTKFDIDKIIIDCVLDLKKSTTIKFNNLKNLNHLSRIISLITLKNSSILDKNFELNFKIIFISEKIFYQNKINNNKVYLCAVLSKNKYYRTKHFWKNIMEVKLAHKLCDHIERLKKLILPEEKKKGIFSKIGNAMGITNTAHKNSMLAKSKILPLIKDYYELEESKVEIVDKMMIQEMQGIIRDCIPNFFKFNISLKGMFLIFYLIYPRNLKFLMNYINSLLFMLMFPVILLLNNYLILKIKIIQIIST